MDLTCNHEPIKKLAKAAKETRLVVFVGAGISKLKPYRCSDWKSLANELIEECWSQGKIPFQLKETLQKEGNLKKNITIAHHFLFSEPAQECYFVKKIESSFNTEEMKNIDYADERNVYNKIKKISNIIITTNADLHIDKHHFSSIVHPLSLNSQTTLHPQSLYKIHGCISDPNNMVFTVWQYLHAYRNDSNALSGFLKNLFEKDYIILFIGYGLEEFELLDYLFKGRQNILGKYYYIQGYFSFEEQLKQVNDKYYEAFGVTQIVYEKDAYGYEGIHYLLDQIIKDIEPEPIYSMDLDDVMRNPL